MVVCAKYIVYHFCSICGAVLFFILVVCHIPFPCTTQNKSSLFRLYDRGATSRTVFVGVVGLVVLDSGFSPDPLVLGIRRGLPEHRYSRIWLIQAPPEEASSSAPRPL
jgi:hypothetical protein